MAFRREESPPLPPGWDKGHTPQGKVYYLHHPTRTTQWKDPRISSSESPPQPHDSPHGEPMGRHLGYESGGHGEYDDHGRGGGPVRSRGGSHQLHNGTKPYDFSRYRRQRGTSPKPLLHGAVQARIDSLVDACLLNRSDVRQDALHKLSELPPPSGCKILDDFFAELRQKTAQQPESLLNGLISTEIDRLRGGGKPEKVDVNQSGHLCLLPKRVQGRVDELFRAGVVRRDEVDQHCLSSLARIPIEQDACDIVDEWIQRLDPGHNIRNVSAWMTRHIANHTKRLDGRSNSGPY